MDWRGFSQFVNEQTNILLIFLKNITLKKKQNKKTKKISQRELNCEFTSMKIIRRILKE